MDTSSGRLINGDLLERLRGEGEDTSNFTPVPEELQGEAERELDGKEETQVDLEADTPLTKWAKSHQATKQVYKAHKVKTQRSQAKASRKRNRSMKRGGKR
jgi:hypothetical protein